MTCIPFGVATVLQDSGDDQLFCVACERGDEIHTGGTRDENNDADSN